MAAFTLKLGDLDLSNYVRVAQGDGLDPAASEYLTPEFQQSGLGEGNALNAVVANNREMAFPMHLNASTRSGVLDLLAGINRRLDGAADGGKLELEWRNEGADNSTFYDVVFGRFDHEYNHRRLAHRWMSGILRCWVKPYGHTGTTRVVATTAVATDRPDNVLGLASYGGDTDALLLDARSALPSRIASAAQALQGWAVVPSGYRVFHDASSITQIAASAYPASYAYRNTVRRLHIASIEEGAGGGGVDMGRLVLGGTVYEGRQRVFGLFRLANSAATTAPTGFVTGQITGLNGLWYAIGPTAPIAGASGVEESVGTPVARWYDLGVFEAQASPVSPTTTLRFMAAIGSWAAGATFIMDLAGVVVVPEDSTMLVNRASRVTTATQQAFGDRDLVLRNGLEEAQYQRGVVPKVPPGRAHQAVALTMVGGTQDVAPIRDAVSADVRVRERFTFER